MKNVRIKIRENCKGPSWSVGLFEGKENLRCGPYKYKSSAIRGAKAMAKRIGIKYDPEIIEQYGC